MTTLQDLIVANARWGPNAEASTREFTYDEIRPMEIWGKPKTVPWIGDCSTWYAQCVRWAILLWLAQGNHLTPAQIAALDPNALGWNGYGNTLTMLNAMQTVPLSTVMGGDALVFGPPWDVAEQHAVVVLEPGANPMCSSMGHQDDPELVPLAYANPYPPYVTALRLRNLPVPLPPPPPAGSPAAAVLRSNPKARPTGTLPTLQPGSGKEVHQAIVYWRLLLRAAGFWPGIWPLNMLGEEFGPKTQNRTIAWKESKGLVADATVGGQSWADMGALPVTS